MIIVLGMFLKIGDLSTNESIFFMMRLPKMHSIKSWSFFSWADFDNFRFRLNLSLLIHESD